MWNAFNGITVEDEECRSFRFWKIWKILIWILIFFDRMKEIFLLNNNKVSVREEIF